jgi:hypothetical protein
MSYILVSETWEVNPEHALGTEIPSRVYAIREIINELRTGISEKRKASYVPLIPTNSN